MKGKLRLLILFLAVVILATACKSSGSDAPVALPVLMYHHIADEGDPSTIITEENFREHMAALKEAGYNAVSFEQVIAYVNNGKKLPEKPICITFDDGYMSNYEFAFPILKEFNMPATIFIIGCHVGKDNYKDTEHPITPHFSYEQAAEMIESGIISIQSHTYDMHQWPAFEQNTPIRDNVLKLPDETTDEYTEILTNDFNILKDEVLMHAGAEVNVLAYPGGMYDELSESTLKALGLKVTVTSDFGANLISRKDPDCLFAMKRCNIATEITPSDLLWLVDEAIRQSQPPEE